MNKNETLLTLSGILFSAFLRKKRSFFTFFMLFMVLFMGLFV